MASSSCHASGGRARRRRYRLHVDNCHRAAGAWPNSSSTTTRCQTAGAGRSRRRWPAAAKERRWPTRPRWPAPAGCAIDGGDRPKKNPAFAGLSLSVGDSLLNFRRQIIPIRIPTWQTRRHRDKPGQCLPRFRLPKRHHADHLAAAVNAPQGDTESSIHPPMFVRDQVAPTVCRWNKAVFAHHSPRQFGLRKDWIVEHFPQLPILVIQHHL